MKMYIIVEDGGDFNAWRGCAKRRKVINQPLGRLWTPIFHQVATFTKYLLMRPKKFFSIVFEQTELTKLDLSPKSSVEHYFSLTIVVRIPFYLNNSKYVTTFSRRVAKNGHERGAANLRHLPSSFASHSQY